MSRLLLGAGTGLLLAIVYTASPLGVWAAALAVCIVLLAGRGLPDDERRTLIVLLSLALAVRVAFIAGMFFLNLPQHDALSIGALAGDEAYYLSRALRARDIMLGFAQSRYDYFVVSDEYGRTSYLTLLTVLQVAFGATPYSMRLLNAAFFLLGAVLLFRLVRRSFGPLPAFGGLALLLFMPSLVASSVSLLKESLYFLVASVLVVCTVQVCRARDARHAALMLAAVAGSLWLLNDLRRGALVLAAGGLLLGFGLRLVGASRARLLVAVFAIAVAVVGVGSQPAVRARAVTAVESAARVHAGHVFTMGHPYKLLDDGFYVKPEAPAAWDLRLTEPQAARFLVRAVTSFLVTPLPWELVSIRQFVFLPEHIVWYLLLVFLPFGLASGWKRDPLVACLLIGIVVPTAAALAVTTGNVGTLLRLRGLVTPYLVWLSALGALMVAEFLLTRHVLPGRAAARVERSMA